jgi:hypothetical protein
VGESLQHGIRAPLSAGIGPSRQADRPDFSFTDADTGLIATVLGRQMALTGNFYTYTVR